MTKQDMIIGLEDIINMIAAIEAKHGDVLAEIDQETELQSVRTEAQIKYDEVVGA